MGEDGSWKIGEDHLKGLAVQFLKSVRNQLKSVRKKNMGNETVALGKVG